ncbi:MAG: sulfotransferase domain-containing protein [Planctomycetota bacterium]|nr:sulfotransferase domain-containing protein [Planctomycetota bacterium]
MILIHTCPPRSASTWVEAVLLGLGEVIHYQVHPRGTASYRQALGSGGLRDRTIYPAVPLPFEMLELSKCALPYRILHVYRDPRDLFVSFYYAMLYSHVVDNNVAALRPILEKASLEEGQLLLLDWKHTNGKGVLDRILAIMQNHLHLTRAEQCLRFEFSEITQKPIACFRAYLDFCEIDLPDQTLKDVLEARTFSHLAGGRKPGEEDPLHHFRKGVSGEWRKKLSPAVKQAFKERFNRYLIDLGYEKDDTW